MNYTLLPGKSYPAGTEAETLSAVRSVLTEVEEMQPKQRTPLFSAARKRTNQSKTARFAPLSEADQSHDAAGPRLANLRNLLGGPLAIAFKSNVLAKIKRKHVAFAALAAFVWLRPMWAVLFVVLSLFLVAGIFFVVGGEKIWRGVMLALHRISKTDPDRAVRIRKRLDLFALRWDMILDRFPNGSVDMFYMPDFQVLSAEEARNETRLAQHMNDDKEQA